jgi:hypothetical protein
MPLEKSPKEKGENTKNQTANLPINTLNGLLEVSR